MDEPDYQQLAAWYAALGHPTRLALVSAVAERPANMTTLAAGFDTSLQATSKHLQVLANAGVLARKPEGRERAYLLNRYVATSMSQWLADTVRQA